MSKVEVVQFISHLHKVSPFNSFQGYQWGSDQELYLLRALAYTFLMREELIVKLGINLQFGAMCMLLNRNTQRCLFVCYMWYPRGDCLWCSVRVAPRLKSTEMNGKIELESLSRSLSQLDQEMVGEEERQLLAFCFLLVFCFLKEVKVGSLCYVICHFLNFPSLHQAM